LEDQKCHSTPKHNLETADDDIGLIAMPSLELLDMLSGEHITEKDE
jgi:hypothetical protein